MKFSMLRRSLIVTTAIVLSTGVHAEQAADSAPSGSAEAGFASETGGIGDIVVTARRREESLQRTPISVVALTSADIEKRGIVSTESLQYAVPNVTLAPSQNVGGTAANIFIRGIGQEDFMVAAEPGVGFYVDGVYLARTTGNLMNLVDIERIEVLRGPQGTLFGKNSIGGAINIVSVAPQPDLALKASVQAGSYDHYQGRLVANVPLADNLFVRVAASARHYGGYQRRLSLPSSLAVGRRLNKKRQGADDSQSGRIQLRWLASDTLTIDVAADASIRRASQSANHLDEVNPNVATITQINGLIAQGKIAGTPYSNALVTKDLLTTYAGGRNSIDQDIYGVSLTATKDVGDDTIKFITAYREIKSSAGTDIDGSDLDIVDQDINEEQYQVSGELQWDGAALDDRLKYTTGLFALYERGLTLPQNGQNFVNELVRCQCVYGPGQQFVTPLTRAVNQSYAVYAQGTYKLTDKLSMTLGARYSHEKKKIFSRILKQDAFLRPTNEVTMTGGNRDSWDSFTYRGGFEYQANRDLMAYVSISKGYKSGGFNGRANPNLPNLGLGSYDPETALTYEGGIRSQWFDRRLRLNLTLFHNDYEDLQLRSQQVMDGRTVTLIGNAAEARIRGIEFEATAVPYQGLTLTGSYGLTDAQYRKIGNAPDITLDSKFQRAPRNTFTLAADYEFAALGGSITLHSDYSYRSREQFQLTASPYDQPAYGLLGARIAYAAPDNRWSVAVFGTNLTDKRYRNSGRYSLLNSAGVAYSGIGAPREFGVRFNVAM